LSALKQDEQLFVNEVNFEVKTIDFINPFFIKRFFSDYEINNEMDDVFVKNLIKDGIIEPFETGKRVYISPSAITSITWMDPRRKF